MKYFVEISPSNIVLNKVVADDNETSASIQKIMKSSNTWLECKKSGGSGVGGTGHIGYTYDSANGVFIEPQPYPSWTLNNTTFRWDPPVAKPAETATSIWTWDEATQQWIDTAPTV